MPAEEAAIWQFCSEAAGERNVSDATLETAIRAVQERGVADLIGVSGYYDVVSMTLNVGRCCRRRGRTSR
jgi:4-carboxymuconolactone decarboxylase